LLPLAGSKQGEILAAGGIQVQEAAAEVGSNGHHGVVITAAAPVPAARRGGVTGRLVALAVLAAATFAAVGAGAGAWLGWRDAPPMAFGNAERLAAVLAPGGTVETLDQVRWSSGWAGRGPGTAGVLPVLFPDEFPTGFEEAVVRTGGETGAVLEAAAGRLAAEGWDAGRTGDDVEATRDGLHLLLQASHIPGDADVPTVKLTVQPTESDRVLTLALTGAAAGAVLGAAVTLLLGRRSGAVRAAVFAVGVLLSGVTVTGLLGLFLRLTGLRVFPEEGQRNGVIAGSMVLSWMVSAGIALALAGVAVAASQSRRPTARPPAR
jgi:hypothetical protein